MNNLALTLILYQDSINELQTTASHSYSHKTKMDADSKSRHFAKDSQKIKAGVHKIFDLDAEDNQKRAQNAPEGTYRITSSTKSKHTESRLSAWEQWVIEKAKEDHKTKLALQQKKKHEKLEKEKLEQEKRSKQIKAQVVRESWVQKKNQEILLKKKIEKMHIKEELKKKEDAEKQIKEKAAEKFDEWQKLKEKEEKEKRKRLKEESQRKQEEESKKKQLAEKKFQEWLKKAHKRPKSAPNSFGYLSGKMTGYHDLSAYPQPSFFNPVPWQSPAIPNSKCSEKNRKPQAKPYKWNPDKYL
ncbi:hypothetical protein Btru_042721 [Bulinus truncatus]|nr:hypothetical protein Btru_042721 [Bulinus truncatus]